MLISRLFTDPLVFFAVFGALVISISVHEFAHAYVAHKLGDDTAKFLGRVTLNPLAHLDPLGTLLLVFVGIGWGKPVPFNPYNLKNPKRDSALIGLAGPTSNFITAGLLAVLFHLLPLLLGDYSLFNEILYFIILYNLFLGVFNLIPFHPLDGFKVVNGLLPNDLSMQWMQTAQFGIYILILLLITDTAWRIIMPVVSFFLHLFGLVNLSY